MVYKNKRAGKIGALGKGAAGSGGRNASSRLKGLLISFLASTTAMTAPAAAGTVVWTGADNTNNTDWLLSGNWSGGVLPGPGDTTIVNGKSELIGGPAQAVRDLGVRKGPNGSGDLRLNSGAELGASNMIRVGVGGAGVIVVEGGSRLQVSGTGGISGFIVGLNAGDNGTVVVDGPGSRIDVTQFTLGQNGQGALKVLNGAYFSIDMPDVPGMGMGSNWSSPVTGRADVLVSGPNSTLDGRLSTVLYIGSYALASTSVATVVIEDGGKMITSAGAIIGSRSSVSVKGSGSSWDTFGTVVVGGGGFLQLSDHAVMEAGAGINVGNKGTETTKAAANILDGSVVKVGSNSGSGSGIYGPGSFVGRNSGEWGDVLISGAGSLWDAGSKLFSLGEQGTGVLTIADGGALKADVVFIGQTSSVTVGASAGNAAAASGAINAGTINLANGGRLVLNHTDTAYILGSGIASTGNGGHLIVESGKSILTGNSGNFSGSVSITGGTLSLGGIQPDGTMPTLGNASSTVSVSGGGALAGAGTIGGSVSILDGGVLAPGNSPGTLTIAGDLSLASGSVLNYEFGEPGTVGGPFNDHTIVYGNLTLDGTLNVEQSAGGAYGPGLYRLISYNGTLTDNGLDIGSLPAGALGAVIQTSIANQVNLIANDRQDVLFWDGGSGVKDSGTVEGGDGVWTAAYGGANSDNWTVADGSLNISYQPTMAVFAGTAGTVTVDGAAGPVTITDMQFAVDGYRIVGGPLEMNSPSDIRVGDGTEAGASMSATIDSVLQGPGSLTKSDLGTLILTNANTYTGGTTIEGGTLVLKENGSVEGGIVNNGVLEVRDKANIFATDGNISGTGRLDIYRSNVVLSGDNTFTGGTRIGDAGSLTIGESARGDGTLARGSLIGDVDLVSDTGILTFSRSDEYSFGGTISGAGQVTAVGPGSLTLTGDNTYGGGTMILGKTVIGSATSFGSGRIDNAGALVLDQATDATMANVLAGSGTFTKQGPGTLELTGASGSFGGATTLSQGELRVNGDLSSSDVTVLSGATLSGSGTVGSVAIQSGGLVAAGTLTIAGGLSFASGSIYEAQVVPGSTVSDVLSIKGAVSLANGAVLNVSGAGNGVFAANARYTLLTATDGVTGTYILTLGQGISPLYTATLGYDANNVYFDIAQTQTFGSVGTTPNQVAVGGGLQALSEANGLRAAVATLQTEDAIRGAFDALSGEIHSTIKGATVEESRFVRNAAIDRIRSALDDVGAPAAPAAGYGFDGLDIWSTGYGARDEIDGNASAAGLNHGTGGFVAGADMPVFDNARFGILAGYAHSTYRAGERHSDGSSDNYSVGAYGGTRLGNLGVRLGAAYTRSDITTSRRVAFGDFSDTLSGRYDANIFQIFGDVGYRVDVGSVSLEPFAALAHVGVRSDAFSENGGLAALTGRSDNTDVTFSTIGLRGTTDIDMGANTLTASGSIAWRHAYGDTTPTTIFGVARSNPFGIAGTPVARDAVLVDVGLSGMLAPNVSLGISYTGQFGTDVQSQGIRGNLNVKF